MVFVASKEKTQHHQEANAGKFALHAELGPLFFSVLERADQTCRLAKPPFTWLSAKCL
jgi:hypothetical protein